MTFKVLHTYYSCEQLCVRLCGKEIAGWNVLKSDPSFFQGTTEYCAWCALDDVKMIACDCELNIRPVCFSFSLIRSVFMSLSVSPQCLTCSDLLSINPTFTVQTYWERRCKDEIYFTCLYYVYMYIGSLFLGWICTAFQSKMGFFCIQIIFMLFFVVLCCFSFITWGYIILFDYKQEWVFFFSFITALSSWNRF